LPEAAAFLNAIGTAVPDHDIHHAFIAWAQDRIEDGRSARLFARMAARSGIDHRWSVLDRTSNGGSPVSAEGFYAQAPLPGTGARMTLYAETAPALGITAIEALAAQLPIHGITHFVVASCTGFVAPGIDQIIARRIGLSPSVERLLIGLPGGALGFLIVVNILIFLLAFFLDYFEIAFIMVPLLAPVAQKLGIDLVWFGVLLAVNMQTSFLHPPFGFALFYLRSVAPKSIKTMDIYWGAVPFVAIQVLMVACIIAFPGFVTGNISQAVDTIKGSGADELRRQIETERAPPGAAPSTDGKTTGGAPKPEDAGSELERLLKQ